MERAVRQLFSDGYDRMMEAADDELELLGRTNRKDPESDHRCN